MTSDIDADIGKRALDELFNLTTLYRKGSAFRELMEFTAKFNFYSPYNAMLVHTQRPGATFVSPAHIWHDRYHRTIKAGARPLVILQPMGPVMFVFDVADTEGEALPEDVINPFSVGGKKIGPKLPKTLENCMRDGIQTHYANMGSQRAGSIRCTESNATQLFRDKCINVRYSLELKQDASPEDNYATLAHELGHLYCGHIGTPNPRWWASRQGLSHQICEIEAESAAHLVCSHFGLTNPSAEYLSQHIDSDEDMPDISLESIMKAAGLISRMAKTLMPLRKLPSKPKKP